MFSFWMFCFCEQTNRHSNLLGQLLLLRHPALNWRYPLILWLQSSPCSVLCPSHALCTLPRCSTHTDHLSSSTLAYTACRLSIDDIFFECDRYWIQILNTEYRIRTNPNNKSDDETSRLVYPCQNTNINITPVCWTQLSQIVTNTLSYPVLSWECCVPPTQA